MLSKQILLITGTDLRLLRCCASHSAGGPSTCSLFAHHATNIVCTQYGCLCRAASRWAAISSNRCSASCCEACTLWYAVMCNVTSRTCMRTQKRCCSWSPALREGTLVRATSTQNVYVRCYTFTKAGAEKVCGLVGASCWLFASRPQSQSVARRIVSTFDKIVVFDIVVDILFQLAAVEASSLIYQRK